VRNVSICLLILVITGSTFALGCAPLAAPPTPAIVISGRNVTSPASTDNDTASNAGGPIVQTRPVSTQTEPPQIIDIAYVASGSSVTVSWKTNEDATSFMVYGTDLSLPFQSMTVTQKSTKHSIFISGLAANMTYHYKLFSTDAAGNTGTTEGDMTFVTSTSNCAPYIGSVAPEFTLDSLQGNRISLSQYRGKKVLLNCWESWCEACKMERPTWQAVWNKYRNRPDVMILTVAGSQSDIAALKDYMAQNNLDFIVCLDEGDGVFNAYNITSTPRTYLLDKGGVIHRIQQTAFSSPDEVESLIDSY